jgi:glycerol-3-phosphate dehydrogenase subunit C
MDAGRGLFAAVSGSSADVAACDSETCRWQITHGSGVASVHPVELLFRAYGLEAQH